LRLSPGGNWRSSKKGGRVLLGEASLSPWRKGIGGMPVEPVTKGNKLNEKKAKEGDQVKGPAPPKPARGKNTWLRRLANMIYRA